MKFHGQIVSTWRFSLASFEFPPLTIHRGRIMAGAVNMLIACRLRAYAEEMKQLASQLFSFCFGKFIFHALLTIYENSAVMIKNQSVKYTVFVI